MSYTNECSNCKKEYLGEDPMYCNDCLQMCNCQNCKEPIYKYQSVGMGDLSLCSQCADTVCRKCGSTETQLEQVSFTSEGLVCAECGYEL